MKKLNLGFLMNGLILLKKLDFKGLPKYEDWFSKLQGDYLLSKNEWDGCQRLFKEKGMCTFADWLRYYNNLDVAPGLEALEKMRAFYTVLKLINNS